MKQILLVKKDQSQTITTVEEYPDSFSYNGLEFKRTYTYLEEQDAEIYQEVYVR